MEKLRQFKLKEKYTIKAAKWSRRRPPPTQQFFSNLTYKNIFRDIVELLLSYEASCNSADDKGSSPLHLASWAGKHDIVVTLLTHGPSISNVNLTVRMLLG